MVSRNVFRALGALLSGAGTEIERFQERKKGQQQVRNIRDILAGNIDQLDEDVQPFFSLLGETLTDDADPGQARALLQSFVSTGIRGKEADRAAEAAAAKAQQKLQLQLLKNQQAQQQKAFTQGETRRKNRASFVRQGLKNFDDLFPELFDAQLSPDQKIQVLEAAEAGQAT